MTIALGLVIFIIFIAFVFDYTNGFHDAANSIATVVSTRVLSPGMAVTWAAFFNFVAFAVLGTRVAKTIGGDLVRMELVAEDMRLYTLLAALLGAIIWNLITWYVGLPTSSSHALDGRLRRGGHRCLRRFSRHSETRGLDQDDYLHCGFAAHRHDARIHLDGGGALDFSARVTSQR